jgi:hypothetical protein
MCEKCLKIDKTIMSRFQIAGVRLGAQHPAPGVNVIRRKSLARAGLLISLNTTHGDRLHHGFVIAELPHKEAATLTWSLRIPGSGGSFARSPRMRLGAGSRGARPDLIFPDFFESGGQN